MRIQHNIMAMNAYRNYNNNTSALSKNLEKLSSGYKINRAGDDAAGLAISEKMRAQITGLNAAQKNVKDGISLVKTGEGAMQEIQDMLNRMDYLATQSANGTYDNEVDRANLQKEVNALKSEINRIADSANFNGIKLLDGTQANKTPMTDITTAAEFVKTQDASNINAPEAQKGVYTIDLSNFKAANATTGTAAGTAITITVGGQAVASATKASATDFATAADFKAGLKATIAINNVEFNVSMDGDKIKLTMKDTPKAEFNEEMKVALTGTVAAPEHATGGSNAGNHAEPLSVTVEQRAIPESSRTYAEAYYTLQAADMVDGFQMKIGNETYTFAIGADSKFKNAANVVDLTDKKATDTNLVRYASQRLSEVAVNNTMFKVTSVNNNGRIDFTEKEGGIDYKKHDMIGKDGAIDADWRGLVQKGQASSSSGLTLQIGDTADSYNQMNVIIGDMHTNALGISNIDISSQASAQSAIATIRDAINNVSSIRGDLGAIQNRLEHTQKNLSVMAENIQDAESTIRDTDVAEEMMSYVKNNILVQSAQAMLAQANQVPQGVLQLLG